jgi:thiosulfate/3-mercaptopyruvate sulfurtransferase
MSFRTNTRFFIVVLIVFICGLTAQAQMRVPPASKQQAQSAVEPLGKDQLLAPEDLVKILRSGGPKPLILSVGPLMLYQQARIPGAEFIGPGSEPQGIAALKQRVKGLSKAKSIVLYCGCCPWVHCPNVEPAYRELRSMGFTKVKVLYIAANLGVDWVYKGYPTER